MFIKINPECCGKFGRKTLHDGELTDRPPHIYRLHYEFDKPPTSELLQINCVFIGSADLVGKIRALDPRATGVFFEEAITTTTPEYRQSFPNQEPGEYKWFKINGVARVDDFGLTPEKDLVVSDRVLSLLK
jgi:hypothetical protein